jgi:hypothetical protein
MRKFTFTFLLLFVALLVISAVQFSSTPPTQRTNAPGEGNCTGCHSGTVNSGSATATIRVDGGRNDYALGATYPVTVTVEQAGISRFGFQLTALDANNQPAGTFTITDVTRTQSQSDNGRTYISHTSSGVDANPIGSQQWTFNWKAPNTAVGRITFYASIMASNRNFSTSGDQIYTRTVFLDPIPFALDEKPQLKAISFHNHIRLEVALPAKSSTSHLAIERSLDGKHFTTVFEQNLNDNQEAQTSYSFKDYQITEGTYFYRSRWMDVDGQITYSRIIQATFSGVQTNKQDFIIEPYYSDGKIYFQLNDKGLTPGVISFQDMSGKTIAQLVYPSTEMTQIPVSLSQGVYIVRFNHNLSRKIWVWN